MSRKILALSVLLLISLADVYSFGLRGEDEEGDYFTLRKYRRRELSPVSESADSYDGDLSSSNDTVIDLSGGEVVVSYSSDDNSTDKDSSSDDYSNSTDLDVSGKKSSKKSSKSSEASDSKSSKKGSKSTKSPSNKSAKSSKTSSNKSAKAPTAKSTKSKGSKSAKAPTAKSSKSKSSKSKSAKSKSAKSTKAPTAKSSKSTKSPTAKSAKSTKAPTGKSTKSPSPAPTGAPTVATPAPTDQPSLNPTVTPAPRILTGTYRELSQYEKTCSTQGQCNPESGRYCHGGMDVVQDFDVEEIGVVKLDMSISWDFGSTGVNSCGAVETEETTLRGGGIVPALSSDTYSCFVEAVPSAYVETLDEQTFSGKVDVIWPDGRRLPGVIQRGSVCEFWTRQRSYSGINQFILTARVLGFDLDLNIRMDVSSFDVLDNPPETPHVKLTVDSFWTKLLRRYPREIVV